MSVVEFPYMRHGKYLVPMIPITLSGHVFWTFVDTGATFSIIHAREAGDVGIDWKTGEPTMIVVGDGGFIPVYLHTLTIRIDRWEVEARMGFSDRLGIGFNILGRAGVFDNFRVCFDERALKMTFQKD